VAAVLVSLDKRQPMEVQTLAMVETVFKLLLLEAMSPMAAAAAVLEIAEQVRVLAVLVGVELAT
jgi:hypothetical protein